MTDPLTASAKVNWNLLMGKHPADKALEQAKAG